MPLDKHPEEGWTFLKFIFYAASVFLGLFAKLATINKDSQLTWKQVLYHTSVAFASAAIVAAIFYKQGQFETAIIAAVIVGRFGDSVLISFGKIVMSWINKGIEHEKK